MHEWIFGEKWEDSDELDDMMEGLCICLDSGAEERLFNLWCDVIMKSEELACIA